jgi:hypothetical protein
MVMVGNAKSKGLLKEPIHGCHKGYNKTAGKVPGKTQATPFSTLDALFLTS